ncbi:hypothetical protein C2845_PM05G21830 [Panicum miliaceum]|uniref:Trehalose 6-phosphate phosphatase n=1 Tax=Panicum miliaceum TaxID=4540 RepID=A0A3L6T120_PANMI|nr:hypothetical protein C2845_PM05G21830 [Panicum miliaceum]
MYGTNLDTLAAVLPSTVASSPLLSANESCGQEATMVYAVAQCRGDTSSSRCKRCVSKNFEDARSICAFRQGALVFRDWCTLGYLSRELIMLSPEDASIDITTMKQDESYVTIQSSTFDATIHELANGVAGKTATSAKRFGTGRIEFSGVEIEMKIYALAQCLPSLSVKDCDSCLAVLFDTLLAHNLTAGRAAKLWCNYRFAPRQFFSGKPILDIPVNGSSPKAVKKHKHKHRKHTPGWVWAVVALGAAVVLLAMEAEAATTGDRSSGEHEKEVQCKGKALAVAPRPWALERFQEIVQLAASKEIVLFLDYDGTLSPIVNDPDEAYISDEMRRTLQDVARCFKTSIVSGRARAKVLKFVGIDEINYAGSHGMDIKLSTATTEEEHGSYQPAEEHLAAITEVYNSLLRATKEIDGAGVENNKYCVSVHFRNVATEDHLRVRKVVEEVLQTKGGGLKMTEGHKVYEVRPPTHWNKGDAVLYLLEHLRLGDLAKVFPIYIGDDRTDEDAFKALREKTSGVGILVSEAAKQTHAFYTLEDPSQVMEFLKLLVRGKREIESAAA